MLHVDGPAERVVEAAVPADTLEPARGFVVILRPRDGAKQLGVEPTAPERGAVDQHELSIAARGVNRTRGDLAARAFLASNQHSGVHRRGARDERHHFAHDGRVAVQIVGAQVGSTPGVVQPITVLSLDCIGDTAANQWTCEHIGHAGRDGLGGQFRSVAVDDGEHRRAGAVGAKRTGRLESGGPTREIEQHRHVPALQFVERGCGAVGPDDREVGGRQDFLRFGSIGGRTT